MWHLKWQMQDLSRNIPALTDLLTDKSGRRAAGISARHTELVAAGGHKVPRPPLWRGLVKDHWIFPYQILAFNQHPLHICVLFIFIHTRMLTLCIFGSVLHGLCLADPAQSICYRNCVFCAYVFGY